MDKAACPLFEREGKGRKGKGRKTYVLSLLLDTLQLSKIDQERNFYYAPSSSTELMIDDLMSTLISIVSGSLGVYDIKIM